MGNTKQFEPVAVVEGNEDGTLRIVPHTGALQRGDSLYTYKQLQLAKQSKLEIDAVHTQLNFTQSDVLTIVEASFSDMQQRQAVIKLVKAAFNKRHHWLDEIVGNGVGPNNEAGDPIDPKAPNANTIL